MSLSRESILTTLRTALEPLDFVHAMWEGGAAAFDRVDRWSDIDLQVLCDDNMVSEVFLSAEEAMKALSPIDLRYEIPQPTWHGHAQAFYRLEEAGPFLLIDFVVMKESSTGWLREREIHGNGPVHFDKRGVLGAEHIDHTEFGSRLERRLNDLHVTFDLFQSLVLKEFHRDNAVEALQFYHGMTLRPLVELLRIVHAPVRYNFHTRYLYYDLPDEITDRLEPLFFVADLTDLRAKHRQAEAWFLELMDSVDLERVHERLHR